MEELIGLQNHNIDQKYNLEMSEYCKNNRTTNCFPVYQQHG